METTELIIKAIAATPTTTSSKYVREFESSFVPIKKEQLRDKARSGNLRHCQFRSLCWRFFLHCLPEHYEQWLDTCARNRQRYEEIRSKHLTAKQQLDCNDQQQPQPHQQAFSSSLSADSQFGSRENASISGTRKQQQQKRVEHQSSSPEIDAKNKELEEEQKYLKATQQCDHKNVLRTIERDVVRTFPDMEFFRQTEMQSILENVLFNFASEYPHISYKQGMHELLATLLYVLHTDSQNCLINYEGGYANETIANLLDLKYLEHDVYQLFCCLMKSIETWYQNDEILVVPDSSSSSSKVGREYGEIIINRSDRSQQVDSVLGNKLKMISENIVKNYDLELFNHLEALQIAPQIYGIRWMRLLFGREFEFLDLLTVWDAIICDQKSMSLTDYIFASMLITIREELVNGDYTDCLNNLMRYQFKDVQYVIKLALYLRDPQNNARPKPIQPGIQKHYSQSSAQRSSRYSPETSLTSKLSQQYISVKNQFQNVNNRNRHVLHSLESQIAHSTRRYSPKTIAPTNIDNRDSRKIFSVTSKPPPSLITNTIKEYEMREMHTASSSSTVPVQRGYQACKFPLGAIDGSSGSRNALNVSTESYDDLHSIVDYCWRLLSEQIDSLQRCLPKEKSLHSEDEIFVALAQLKKVRDVLKGSLRLEDELEPQAKAKSERNK